MIKKVFCFACSLLFSFFSADVFAVPVIYVNQVAMDTKSVKIAVISNDVLLNAAAKFTLINSTNNAIVFTGKLSTAMAIEEWMPGKFLYQADFSSFIKQGKYKVSVTVNGKQYLSDNFIIEDDALAKLTIPSILQYYHHQRATTPEELAADKKLLLFGSDKTVDLQGGWCDASGDISKYFSHLAYANFMSPQQIPLVTWSMESAVEAVPKLLTKLGIKDSLQQEALFGADYIVRSLAPEGFFYMTVFSYFKPDPSARRVVGLLANSITTNDYQCAFREGGGMAIAALARISTWKKDGAFTATQYLDAAKKGFAHLLINNTKYDDDHKENIIDDYCALMAATELWIATNDTLYKNEARKRADNLSKRITKEGYFIADDANRPFWHASDAGMPVVSLSRYLTKEKDDALRSGTILVIKKALAYNLSVTNNTSNPFGYARQTFRYKDSIKNGFFIPHDNESGWWWQGENARLASLATAAIVGGKLIAVNNKKTISKELNQFASQQLSWILGNNPYQMCFMYQFGKNNVPYMASRYGHGSGKGGISNGITGKDGNGDGSGIDFKKESEGNEWRWTEQWIPHAAWFLQAISTMAEE